MASTVGNAAPGKTIAIAVVGIGKIARDQHLPTIASNDRFRFAATVSLSGADEGVPTFKTIPEMVAACPDVSAVAVCTPPRGRLALIREALAHGLDVLVEKPPAATLSEAEAIAAAASGSGRVLYATWHSRAAPGVEPAREWVSGRKIDKVAVAWKEDVRVWHPGQEWIWEPGIGVFDPGINALSILTRVLPAPLLLDEATLGFPENKAAPIEAALKLTDAAGVPVEVDFNFDQRGPQTWEIAIISGADTLRLTHGGGNLELNGAEQPLSSEGEYPRLYARFAELVDARQSEVDLSPFRLVADAFLLGRRNTLGAFDWNS